MKEKIVRSSRHQHLHHTGICAYLGYRSILFVHGLGGHWQDTWKSPKSQKPWPQQLLPSHVKDARILSFGYDSHITDLHRVVSQNTVWDHAQNLLRDLSNYREKDQTVRT